MYEEEEYERPNFTGQFGGQESKEQDQYQIIVENEAVR